MRQFNSADNITTDFVSQHSVRLFLGLKTKATYGRNNRFTWLYQLVIGDDPVGNVVTVVFNRRRKPTNLISILEANLILDRYRTVAHLIRRKDCGNVAGWNNDFYHLICERKRIY